MSAYEIVGTISGVAVVLSLIIGAAWRIGRAGRGEPAAAIYEQMNKALTAQVEQLKAQNTEIKAQNADQQRQIEVLKADVAHLTEQVLQRAKVDELAAIVKDRFDGLSEEHSVILGRVNEIEKGRPR